MKVYCTFTNCRNCKEEECTLDSIKIEKETWADMNITDLAVCQNLDEPSIFDEILKKK